MNQWNGLMKKEWLLMKDWFYGLVISVVIATILIAAFLFTISADGMTVTVIVGVAAMVWIVVILFLPLTILLNSLQKESSRPDVWLHSEVSIFKLCGAKLVFAGVISLISILFPAIILFSYLGISGTTLNEFSFIELLIFAGTLFSSFFASSLLIAVIGLFFAVLHQLIKPTVKGMSIPILVVVFFLGAWLWERIKVSSLFIKVASFGPIGDPSKEDIYIERDGFFIGPTEPVIYTGNILITIFFLSILFVTAAVLFEKKVRL